MAQSRIRCSKEAFPHHTPQRPSPYPRSSEDMQTPNEHQETARRFLAQTSENPYANHEEQSQTETNKIYCTHSSLNGSECGRELVASIEAIGDRGHREVTCHAAL